MTQELTVALRIKAFLAEARQSVQQFNRDLKGVGDAADQAGAKLGRLPTKMPAPAPAAAPAPMAPPASVPARLPQVPPALGGLTDKQTQMAMRQLPMQLTDIFTSLASGMPAWMVFIQQGGQIRDSFGGGTNALKAMLSVLTPLRVGLGLVGAAAAAVVLAYKQGSEEADAFSRGLIMSGNAAGTTAGELQDMARAADQVSGTHAKAAAVLAQMAASGEVARRNLQQFTETAIALERAGGPSVEETAKHFEELGKRPLEATVKLTESLRYMTGALYDQLQALTRSGQEERAAEVAQQAYARAMSQRAAQLEGQLGTLERAWRGVKDIAKEAWDAMLSIGRPDSASQQIAQQIKVVEELERRLADRKKRGLATGNLADLLGAARNRLQDLQQDKDEQASLARTQAETAKVAEEYRKAREANQRYADAALTKQELLNKKLEEYRRNNDKIRAGGGTITDAQIKAQERAIYEEVFGKGAGLSAAKAQAELQRTQLRADLQLLQQAVRDGDAIVVQALKDGNVSIDAAYAARLSQLQTETAAQRRTLEAEAAEVEKALRAAKTTDERAPLLQQKVEIEARLKLLDASLAEGARQLALWKTEQERQLSSITAKIRVDVAGITGRFDAAAVRQQLQDSMRGDLEAVGRIADPAEQQAARDRLQLLLNAGMAQAEFNAKLAEAQRLQGHLSVQEGAIRVLQEQGIISATEAQARLRQARADQVPVLQQILLQLQAIRAAMPPEAAAAIDAMSRSIGELENQAKAATPVVVDLGTRLRNTAIDGLADAAANAVTNFRNLRSAVADTLKGIAADIVRSGLKRVLTDAFTPDSAGGGGGGGGLFSAIFAGVKSIFGFADGGLIRGPGTGTSDSIPALVGGKRPIAVSNEEFIQPQRAVKHYGVGFMEAVRTLRFPRPGYAFGGLVAAHQRARYATGGLVAGGAGVGQMPNVTFQLVTQGTQQRVVDQKQQFDGKNLVVSVFLDDLARGGPMSQAMKRRP